MQAVVDFFASFSLNNMPDMESLKELKEKESSGFPGYSAGRGFDLAGGAPGVPSYMPLRRRGRGRGQFQESEGQNEDRRSIPLRGHDITLWEAKVAVSSYPRKLKTASGSPKAVHS
ncbi:auxilin-related protein 2 [Dorcoceras hygrometricum]|uniref:Auxilin-related protein 2 n=1 Tax=Dorcoceras hygrometricum TaxID=472368 RepID=A0A2Z7A3S8_9LAMI|nr:auxilin-related protein 2 [Dorcoceras hygrometricum]